jgi:hypothetical protein
MIKDKRRDIMYDDLSEEGDPYRMNEMTDIL